MQALGHLRLDPKFEGRFPPRFILCKECFEHVDKLIATARNGWAVLPESAFLYGRVRLRECSKDKPEDLIGPRLGPYRPTLRQTKVLALRRV